jgi:hypothetical protein
MKFDTTQDYVEDPESLKFEAVKAERKAIREKYGNTVFRPSSTPKSLRTSSVANHPRNQVCFKWLAMDLLRSDGAVEHQWCCGACFIEDILLPTSLPSLHHMSQLAAASRTSCYHLHLHLFLPQPF